MLVVIIVLYFLLMIAIGVIASRRVKSSEGFLLGGKSFGPWFTAFKFAATLESGTKLIGTPGMAFGLGYPAFLQGMWTPIAYFLSFRCFGERLKIACEHFKVLTVPQLLEKRYGGKHLRVLSAIAILVGLGGSLIAQFKASGEIFSSIFGTTYLTGLIVGVIVVGLYSIIGGYTATVWTDLIQGIVMVFGVIILLVATVQTAFGSFRLDFLVEMNRRLAETAPNMLALDGGGGMPIIMIITMSVIGCIVGIAQPQQAVALFSMRDTRVAKSAMVIATVFSSILIWCLLPSAMLGRLILDPSTVPNSDAVMPILTQTVLSPTMAGLVMAAVLSAIMSTVSGLIVVAASAVSHDIMDIVAPKVYHKNPVAWDRAAAGLIVLICFLFAINPPSIIFWIVLFAFGFTVFTFVMPMVGVVLWKKATCKAVTIQMIVTMILIPAWQAMTTAGITKISGLTVGMIVTPILFILISLTTKNGSQEDVDSLWEAYKTAGVSSSK
ncbi:hypothetical protein AALA99_07265 [Anaerotruncus colihominis]|uniref:sodium:solute symporter family transporter n=1 Tax=Anaerotruncus colihominis TaxID=169435 RepID=UPI00351780CF